MVRIRLGTSGYSYDDWAGPFYPRDLDKRHYLEYYAQVFDTVEINYTYYRMPDAATLKIMADKVGEDFCFAIKANSAMTHERSADETVFDEFVAALKPLREQGKLGVVLAQFPWSFRPSEESVAWLRQIARFMEGLPVVVEFRNAAWIHDEAFELLDDLGFGFCCVDQPRLRGLIPPIIRVTGSIAYVRFHGRNAEKWWQHDEAWERYNYLYSREELAEWVPKIGQLSERAEVVYAFFNNHYQAQAVQNAILFREMLAEAGIV
jgi:uncharacterized protein YecE (DUF72 family)